MISKYNSLVWLNNLMQLLYIKQFKYNKLFYVFFIMIYFLKN